MAVDIARVIDRKALQTKDGNDELKDGPRKENRHT
jgi:hypothetical protein